MFPGTHAQTRPNKAAVVMATTGQQVTYAQLNERSLRLANWFRAQGLRRGDVVALISNNDLRVFDVYWAAQRAGLYLTSINYRLTPDEINYILQNSEARCLVLGDVDSDLSFLRETNLPKLEHRVSFSQNIPNFSPLEAVIASGSDDVPDYEPRGGDMLYSSGTTGKPKGVRASLPDRAVSEPGDAMVAMFSEHFHCNSETVYLCPAPIYHAAPLRTCTSIQALGGTVVVMEKFDPEAALAAIERYRVTVSQWVPTMFVRMLKLPPEVRSKRDLSSLRVAIHAAAPCPVDVKWAMMKWWGPILYEFYSCTEVNGITVIRPEEWTQRPGSVGKPILGILHICDEEGNELSSGQDGLVYFEREKIPFEYHGDPEKTRSTQHPLHATWTSVGDIGHTDSEGFLYLTDRKAFMIISGGVNIYPQEVENILALHPAIADIAVIGVPDEEMGEQVKAVVELSPNCQPSPELAQAIIEYAKSKVAGYKSPRSVDFVEKLPRSPTGKLVKGDVRKLYWPSKT